VEHRGCDSQAHLAVIHSREALVRSRTQMINHVRGTVKSFGYRLPKCSTPSFHKNVPGQLPSELAEVLGSIVETIGSLTEKIKDYDRRIEELAAERYPETRLLRQVSGVGSLTALTFVLALEDPQRFAQSRSVGAYLGLAPATDQSGEKDPQKRISGEGDELLRRLLVSSAHYTSWARSLRTPTLDATDRRSHNVVVRMPKSGQWWRWPENSVCCFIASGSRGRSTKRCTMLGVWEFRERR
jgi:transposase